MKRIEARGFLPILQAWADCKEIQVRENENSEWQDVYVWEGFSFVNSPSNYRIKPETK